MKFSSWIAWRYFFSGNSSQFGPFLSAVSVTGIAIAIFFMVVVMSVMTGFRSELTDRLIGFNAHVEISADADSSSDLSAEKILQLANWKGLGSVQRYVEGEVIARSDASGEMLLQGARLRGIDPDDISAISRAEFHFPQVDGSEENGWHGGALIGREIVGQILVHPDFGDSIEIVAPLAEVGPSGELSPNMRKVRVDGVFKTGIYEHDSKFILLPYELAEAALGLQGRRGFRLFLADPFDAQDLVAKLNATLPEGWTAIGWQEKNKRLLSALRLERIGMGIILTLALVISSLSIGGVLLLLIASKRKDMAVLRSLGLRERSIAAIFSLNSFYIGMAGTLIGMILGVAVCLLLEAKPLSLPSSYYLEYLPVDLSVYSVMAPAVLGSLVSIAAGIRPAFGASKFSVADALRYE
ncbi:MAG TPA: ABC transporter permease [bacterium]|nr:ABC transporter permease [bacterium]